MAYVVSNRTARFSLGDYLGNVKASLKANLARRAIYRQTLNELNALTDRELVDLGISRFEVTALAHEAAYGK